MNLENSLINLQNEKLQLIHGRDLCNKIDSKKADIVNNNGKNYLLWTRQTNGTTHRGSSPYDIQNGNQYLSGLRQQVST